MSSNEWFVGFHEGLVARFWRAAGAAMADDDARVVLALLGGAPLRVLDAPCGDGRISVRLAAAGHEVTGIDIAPAEVELAREAVPEGRFEVGDLRALPAGGQFDAVVSWGNAFGYLEPAETAGSLRGMRAALRPGGRLLLESLTVAESFLPGGIRPRAGYEFGGIRMVSENAYHPETGAFVSELTLYEGDAVQRARSVHHVHTAGEVVRMLRAAGFADVELRSDAETPYALGAPRMIAIATAAGAG